MRREIQMRIRSGIAVSWEMFRGGQNVRARHRVRARNECGNERRNVVRIFSVGSDIDDRVVRIVVDIGIRKEEPLRRPAHAPPAP